MKRFLVMSSLLLCTGLIFITGCDNKSGITEQVSVCKPATLNETQATSRPGLLLVAHGAPWPKWNRPLLDLEKQVCEKLDKKGNPFHAVKLVFMEFASPDVADGIEAMQAAGCDRIIVVPLLIAPSSHSHWDVPALLGIYSDPEMRKTLEEEGTRLVKSKLPITLMPTLADGELIENIMLRQLERLSKDPQNEAVVVLAHGDEGLQPIWDSRMKELLTYLCGKSGISYGDYAFVHIGQSYVTHGVAAVAKAAEKRKRVILLGCYLAMGPEGMHRRYMRTPVNPHMPMPNPLKGKDIVCATQGLLPDPAVANWIVQTARTCVD